jgi:glycosyltransferase involved in cell wall biosynthesis
MRIAYVSIHDPRDPTKWAGTTYHIAKALESHGAHLEFIGPLREEGALGLKVRQWAYGKLRRQALHRDREPRVLDGYARQVERALLSSRADVVFSPGTIPLARLKTDRPIAFWTDATYASILREYRWELPASARSRAMGHAQERAAIERSALCVYSSDWAARSAVEDYGADPARVKVVPFGANVAEHRTLDDVTRLIDARRASYGTPCRLLFAGIGWERKGGDVAIEVARRVHQRGVPVELSMLGSDLPAATTLPDFVRAIGFVDKRTPDGRARFDELFGSSHFFLFPARGEAFGVVLCEAASFGLPCLTTRTGGIPTIVRDGGNGILFDRDDPGAIADAVVSLSGDWARYRALALSSFLEYRSRLNWDVAGRTMVQWLRSLV